jgi:hypothetical protein
MEELGNLSMGTAFVIVSALGMLGCTKRHVSVTESEFNDFLIDRLIISKHSPMSGVCVRAGTKIKDARADIMLAAGLAPDDFDKMDIRLNNEPLEINTEIKDGDVIVMMPRRKREGRECDKMAIGEKLMVVGVVWSKDRVSVRDLERIVQAESRVKDPEAIKERNKSFVDRKNGINICVPAGSKIADVLDAARIKTKDIKVGNIRHNFHPATLSDEVCDGDSIILLQRLYSWNMWQ